MQTKIGIALWCLVLLGACQKPKVSELLKGGLDCDVLITTPEEVPARGEKLSVKARFSNCHEVE